ncbi:MAG: hypothetical protein GX096_10220 [Clostridiales bacterium]|nr:hypothetical protein [Clostridiales bacterium]
MRPYNKTSKGRRCLVSALVILLFSSPAHAAAYCSIDQLHEEVQSG